MSFTVAVDQFEGPLDLMLHLIKEKELDLFDLDIHVLTEQYLLYLNKMEEMHLEVCSEYLVELGDADRIQKQEAFAEAGAGT